MATYAELRALPENPEWGSLVDKVVVATFIKATEVIDEPTSSVEKTDWARSAIRNPVDAANGIIWYVVGANEDKTVDAILNAPDNAVQNNVNNAVDAVYVS